MTEDTLPFGSAYYLVLLGLLIFSRAMDFLSTWIGTPNLIVESNPIAKKLGWKLGAIFNIIVCFMVAMWPLPAIVFCTISLLVAARNFQYAWLMRTMGEENYRDWFVARLHETHLPLYLCCLLGQSFLTGLVGGALIIHTTMFQWALIPFAIGVGISAYAFLVTFFTLLAVWKFRRAHS